VNNRSNGFTTTTTNLYQGPIRTRCRTTARMPCVEVPEQPWAVVVPVKRLDVAKTRLEVPPRARVDLALAMATDTVRACLAATAVAAVVVVTDDARAAAQMRQLAVRVVADEPDAGLNPALRHGAVVASDAGGPIAALSSDLPALTGAALDEVLRAAARSTRACVADATGTGTTTLTARGIDAFLPEFGVDSLRRHVAAGAVDLTASADPRVRRDVDTLADLADALRLGCGAATTPLATAILQEVSGS
jgi:2-phospho-L-lactate guanylyltransferase